MTTLSTYQLRCDRCGTHAESGLTRDRAALNARRDGWELGKLSSDGDLCGSCWQAVMHGADA